MAVTVPKELRLELYPPLDYGNYRCEDGKAHRDLLEEIILERKSCARTIFPCKEDYLCKDLEEMLIQICKSYPRGHPRSSGMEQPCDTVQNIGW